MQINMFDVVELQNKNKATILNTVNNKYLVEIVDKEGNRKEIKEITKEEIKKIIYRKNSRGR